MKKILIIGATSAIAIACARLWVAEKAEFFLVGRNSERLRQAADDLTARGAGAVHTHVLDMNKIDHHAEMLKACFAAMPAVDIALIAHGTLPDQTACQQDVSLAIEEFSSNGLSVIAILTELANRMEIQHAGTIVVISSVAGDRGRFSNYLYGAAKAAVSAFCEGLRARLFHAGVHVVTVKPGFVDTPMTRGLALPRALVVPPERVALDIARAVRERADAIYTPQFWALIMFIIRTIPGFVFKRLKL